MKTKVKLETETALTIRDITDKHHLGFIDDDGDKGFCQSTNSGFALVGADGFTTYGVDHNAQQETINSTTCMRELYSFTTRKELYQWLAE